MSINRIKTKINLIKQENDKMIMKAYGLEYEKFFPQDHQDEK